MKLLIRMTKEGNLRFISHLEYSRTLARAVRRAGLPIAYSEGFNPHIKMSLASALSVGVASVAEYAEFDLAAEITPEQAKAALNESLPDGIRVLAAAVVEKKAPKLMASLAGADYEAVVDCVGEDAGRILASIDAYNKAPFVLHAKKTPPGKPKREVDMKVFVETVTAERTDIGISMSFFCVITPEGTVKAQEVLLVLEECFGAPFANCTAYITRKELYAAGKSPLITGGAP